MSVRNGPEIASISPPLASKEIEPPEICAPALPTPTMESAETLTNLSDSATIKLVLKEPVLSLMWISPRSLVALNCAVGKSTCSMLIGSISTSL